MGWFRKKKVPYVPQGRVGYFRKCTGAWKYVVIVEEIGRINHRSQIKILDVQVDRGMNDTKKACLNDMGGTDYIITDDIHWETPEQQALRLGGTDAFLVQRDVAEVRTPDLRPLEQRNPPHVFNIDD
jgi:hypothetical protein